MLEGLNGTFDKQLEAASSHSSDVSSASNMLHLHAACALEVPRCYVFTPRTQPPNPLCSADDAARSHGLKHPRTIESFFGITAIALRSEHVFGEL